MIALSESANGVILPVRAKPAARIEGVIDERDGALRVAVAAAPEQGKANEAVIRVLAETLGLRKSQITLVAGATSRQKRFLVTGIRSADLLNRIEAVLEPTVLEIPEGEP